MALIVHDTQTLDRLNLVDNKTDALGDTVFSSEIGIALSVYQSDLRRAYAAGYVHGVLVGLGFEEATTLRVAETVPYARPWSFENLMNHYDLSAPRWQVERAQLAAEASGTLRGYKDSTDRLPDAYECIVCERRVVRDLDRHGICQDGITCADQDCWWDASAHCSDCLRERE